MPWNNGAMSYIHTKIVSRPLILCLENLTCPLVITFVLACGLVEAGPALAFVALLLTEAALQETGEATKLAFHNFAKCTTTSCHSFKYLHFKKVFSIILSSFFEKLRDARDKTIVFKNRTEM
jgi:hypothetical protein